MMQYLGAIFLSLGLLTLGGCNAITDTTTTLPDDTTPPALISDTGTTDVMDDSNEDITGLDLSTLQISSNGTEPFWHFVASGNTAIFMEPTQLGPIATTSYTISMTQTPTTITINGSGFDALLTLQTCSDGMSDFVYAYKSVVTKGSDTLIGCANIIL